MEKLKEVTSYIVVSVKDELPTANWWYWVYVNGLPERRSVFFYGATNGWYNDNDCLKPFYKPVTHLLKPTSNVYVLTPDELKTLLQDTWDAADNWNHCEHMEQVTAAKHNKPDKEQYIKTILP